MALASGGGDDIVTQAYALSARALALVTRGAAAEARGEASRAVELLPRPTACNSAATPCSTLRPSCVRATTVAPPGARLPRHASASSQRGTSRRPNVLRSPPLDTERWVLDRQAFNPDLWRFTCLRTNPTARLPPTSPWKRSSSSSRLVPSALSGLLARSWWEGLRPERSFFSLRSDRTRATTSQTTPDED